ncbi:MAG: rhodanese-related sulfurtransferase [Paracoccaceae bacterium]|jgi:rhodanese-related sulfurtransferase
MSTGIGPRIGELLPADAWSYLTENQGAVLIDVRTKAEWGFVGIPDLSQLGRDAIFAEWQSWPNMSQNTLFVETVMNELGGTCPPAILFLCRSGVRSQNAAQAVAEHLETMGLDAHCINVVEGFEGDLDILKQRGALTGWKARGLPWRQS